MFPACCAYMSVATVRSGFLVLAAPLPAYATGRPARAPLLRPRAFPRRPARPSPLTLTSLTALILPRPCSPRLILETYACPDPLVCLLRLLVLGSPRAPKTIPPGPHVPRSAPPRHLSCACHLPCYLPRPLAAARATCFRLSGMLRTALRCARWAAAPSVFSSSRVSPPAPSGVRSSSLPLSPCACRVYGPRMSLTRDYGLPGSFRISLGVQIRLLLLVCVMLCPMLP